MGDVWDYSASFHQMQGYAIAPENPTHVKASDSSKVLDDDNDFTRVQLPLYSPVLVELPSDFDFRQLDEVILYAESNSMTQWFYNQDKHVQQLIVAHRVRYNSQYYSMYFNVPDTAAIAQDPVTKNDIEELEEDFWTRFGSSGAWHGIMTEDKVGQRLAFFYYNEMRTILSLNCKYLCQYTFTEHARALTRDYFEHRFQADEMPSTAKRFFMSKSKIQQHIMACLAKHTNFPCAAIQETANNIFYVFPEHLHRLGEPTISRADAFHLLTLSNDKKTRLRPRPSNDKKTRLRPRHSMTNAVAGAAVSVAAAGALAHAYKKMKTTRPKETQDEQLRF